MIVMVDDEMRWMDSYKRELELSGYQVSFHRNVDGALTFLQQSAEQVDILILDIMMPAGSAFEDENTDSGLRTGMFFFERVREIAPDLPVMILTNVSDERQAERFDREKKCRFLRKEDYRPFELVEEVRDMLSTSQNQE
jgi:two-component system C4-dicarboxylate transport response regulator DctD